MYVLVPLMSYHMVYGPFDNYDDAEAFAIKNALVATHRPAFVFKEA